MSADIAVPVDAAVNHCALLTGRLRAGRHAKPWSSLLGQSSVGNPGNTTAVDSEFSATLVPNGPLVADGFSKNTGLGTIILVLFLERTTAVKGPGPRKWKGPRFQPVNPSLVTGRSANNQTIRNRGRNRFRKVDSVSIVLPQFAE